MTKEMIRDMIHKKIEQLDEPFHKDDSYFYIKSYLENNQISRIRDFADIDIWECIKCMYFIRQKRGLSFEKCSEIFDNFTPFLNGLAGESFENFVNICYFLRDDNLLEDIYSYLK